MFPQINQGFYCLRLRAHMEWLGHPTLPEIEQISEKLS